MLQATLANDTKTMEKSYRMFTTQKHRFYRIIMKQSYQQLWILPTYQQEISIALKEKIKLERFCGFYFYPYDRAADGVILELKVDKTPEYAISQIKEKQYALRFKGKLAENSSLQEEFWQLESITIRKQNSIDAKWKK